jgi:hypothetical protein
MCIPYSRLQNVQIWVCRGAQGGFTPLTPTKELFEKSSLESQKLSKMVIYQYIFESS